MKNSKITRKITQGMYVLTTKNGGCIVDAVSQVSSGENPLIAVAVMKKNYTNKLLHENETFALSVLGKKVDDNLIQTFGYQTSKEINKLESFDILEIENEKIIKNSLGYMICEIVDRIENDTHTLVIGKMIEADVFKEEEPMSYGYYQEHKEDYIKIKTEQGTAWICTVCGYIYYGEELPDNFTCPVCGVPKELFKKK